MLVFTGCSDSSGASSTPDTAVRDAGSDAAVTAADASPDATADATTDTGALDTGALDTGTVDADALDAGADTGPVQSCDEIGASACFSNYDCAQSERCDNVGTADAPVACCVSGARGTKAAGDTCTEADDGPECASGICITGNSSSLCSTTCTTADDCPAGMKTCQAIAFSGSNDKWCFPSN